MSPHQIIDRPVPVYPQRKVHRDDRVLEVPMHDEVGVREPYVLMVVDGVQELVLRLVGVAEPGVEPLLLQQELDFIFL